MKMTVKELNDIARETVTYNLYNITIIITAILLEKITFYSLYKLSCVQTIGPIGLSKRLTKRF